MNARILLKRLVTPALLLSVWFVTMTGGWGDVAGAVMVEAAAQVGHSEAAPLPGRTLPGSDELGMPTRLEVSGDELLILDRYRTEALIAVDRRSGRVLRSFGREGDGPGEFRSPVSFATEGDGLAVLDVGLNRVTWLASDRADFTMRGTTQLETEAPATDLALPPDGDILVVGFLGDGRLVRLARDGEFIAYEGAPAGTDHFPPHRRIEALQGAVRTSPAGDRLVRTHRFASRINVVHLGSSIETEVWGPEPFEPSTAGDAEARFGYLDSAPRADGFLALYSGRTREESPGRANYGATVHEFDWEGHLRAEYQLDADVIAIAWSHRDALLYAIRHDPSPAVLVYELDR